jgi:hypothetical protein
MKVIQIYTVHSLYNIYTLEFQFFSGSTVEIIVVVLAGAVAAAEVVSTTVCMYGRMRYVMMTVNEESGGLRQKASKEYFKVLLSLPWSDLRYKQS